MQVLDLRNGEIVDVDLDKDAILDYVKNHRPKCRLYTSFSFYEVERTEDNLLVKIDNKSKKIESFTTSNLEDLYYNISSSKEINTCRLINIIPNTKFKFNLRASTKKVMFKYSEGALDVVVSDLPIINSLKRIVIDTNKYPRRLLMWEVLGIDELYPNVVFKYNFINNCLEDIEETDVEEIMNTFDVSKSYKKFRSHLLEKSGHTLSDGRDKDAIQFDFVTTSETDIPVRSEIYDNDYMLIKNKILCNYSIAMGSTSYKSVPSLYANKFISRMIMVFKYNGIVPCFSIINFKNMFGFYSIWYLHPDVTLYGNTTIKDLFSLLDLVDSEDVYDSESEVLDVWRYFIPYYMADNWKGYLENVAEEKSKLSGFSITTSTDLVNEKDFIEYFLVNKFTEKPLQLTNRNIYGDSEAPIHFSPGVIPDEYKLAMKGTRCNLYVFEEDGDIYVRDCINLRNYKFSKLSDSESERYIKAIAEMQIKYNLVFSKVSPVLYVCRVNGYFIRMSQLGVVYMSKEESSDSFMLEAPTVANDDLMLKIQFKKFSCHTKDDKMYSLEYGHPALPELVERAMYRSKGLDGFKVESELERNVFGKRREPLFDNDWDRKQCYKWNDIRSVYNLYTGSNLMQWVRMGARGSDSNARVLDLPNWDRTLWYCSFNTWFASIEMAELAEDGNRKENLKVILNNRYNPEYYYQVEEFYFCDNVSLVKGNIPGKPWRLVVDSYPIQFVDLSNVYKTDDIDCMYHGQGKGYGIFILALSDEDILFRSMKYLVVESDGHRYLIGGKNQFEINVVENQIISDLDRVFLKSLESVSISAYTNGIWKLLFTSDFTKVDKLNDKMYYVKQYRHSYGTMVSEESIQNPKTIAVKFYVYIDVVLYVFRYTGDIDSVERVDDSCLKVNDDLLRWDLNKSEYVIVDEELESSSNTETSDDADRETSYSENAENENVENSESEGIESKEFTETNIFKGNGFKAYENLSESERAEVDDWLYKFDF